MPDKETGLLQKVLSVKNFYSSEHLFIAKLLSVICSILHYDLSLLLNKTQLFSTWGIHSLQDSLSLLALAKFLSEEINATLDLDVFPLLPFIGQTLNMKNMNKNFYINFYADLWKLMKLDCWM